MCNKWFTGCRTDGVDPVILDRGSTTVMPLTQLKNNVRLILKSYDEPSSITGVGSLSSPVSIIRFR